LEQAIEAADQANPMLERMRDLIAEAEGGKQVSFAEFWPKATLSYRYITGTPTSEPFVLPTLPTYVGNFAFGGDSSRFDLTELNVQWVLWDFGRTLGRYGQATAAVDIARLQYLRARQTVAFNVIVAYLAVLQAQASERVAEEAVRRAEAVLKDARNFQKRGTAIRNDVLRAEVLLAEVRLNRVKAHTAEGVGIAGLNQAIGINVSSPTQVVDRQETPDLTLSLADCLRLAVDNRDEFATVLRVIRSARLGTTVAAADFLPKILVGGAAVHEAPAGHPEANVAAGGLNIELALFRGGERLGKLHTAQAEAAAAIAQGKEVCDRIAYEVDVAFLGIDDARQRLALARTAVDQGTENLRVVMGLFEKGDATPTEVVDAELALTQAQQNYYTALYDYQSALARLAYAVGLPVLGGFPGSNGACCHE
jgi:outer membrane protein TolC